MSTETLPFDAETVLLSGKNLVEASAGTGKTHAVATLFRRLVEGGTEASAILVVTFTEAATSELRERVRSELVRRAAEPPGVVPEAALERVRRALESIDEAPISTIHGFCQRVLGEYALKSGVSFGAELVPDLEELYDDVLYDFWGAHLTREAPELMREVATAEFSPAKLRALLGELRKKPGVPLVPGDNPLGPPLLALFHEFERYARRETFARKERRGVLGFEDLLERVHDALTGRGGPELARTLRDRYRAVLVDEFQDTDPTQADIFQRVFSVGEHPMFLIGDPKQAIYSFRGADVFGYLAAAEGARRHGMRRNWRSDPGVVAAVNAIFEREGSFFAPGIEYQSVAPRPDVSDALEAPPERGAKPFDVVFVRRGDATKPMPKPKAKAGVARLVAADIAALLKSDASIAGQRVIESDIAVLTRTNAECFLVQNALRTYGVHSVVIGDKSVFDSEEGGELEFVLGAVLEPGRPAALRQALTTRLFGVNADAIAGIEDDPAHLQRWLERFRAWNTLWVERGFMRMFRALLAETGAAEKLLEHPGGERRLTNVLHLGELLHRASNAEHLGPAALASWLGEQRRGETSARAEHAEIRLESDERAVRLLTVHKAKGLEFPIVYCPYLWASGLRSAGFPLAYHDAKHAPVLDVHLVDGQRKHGKELAKAEQFAEELRVVYVALTRAKRRTTVFWGGFNDAGGSPASCLFFKRSDKDRGAVPVKTWLGKKTDAELVAELRELERTGSAAVRFLDWDFDTAPLVRSAGKENSFSARSVERPVRAWQRVDSFSALVKHVVHAPDDDDVVRDRDDGTGVVNGLEVSAGSGDVRVAPGVAIGTSGEPVTPNAPSEEDRIVLDGFPRGRVSGDFFHAVLETIDFETATGADLLDVATEKLETFGLARGTAPDEADQLLAKAVASLRDLLDTPLMPAGGVRLRDVTKNQRFSELEFHVPVTGGAGSRGVLHREALAAVFRDHPSAELPPSYAERVARLGFEPLSGFLKGYIDLVFRHAGRWYVVDYKTNHLSDFVHEYETERMTEVMAESHYFLQYHLYALAVSRFLGRYEPGFDYEEHFGGALYLFTKGMRPGRTTGVFFEKPPLSRLRALSRAFGGPAW